MVSVENCEVSEGVSPLPHLFCGVNSSVYADTKITFWGISSVVEHLLCKQGVTGSNPVSSTNMGRKRDNQGARMTCWSMYYA